MQDSHQRIAYKRSKPMITELKFEKISKTVKNWTTKPRNLSIDFEQDMSVSSEWGNLTTRDAVNVSNLF